MIAVEHEKDRVQGFHGATHTFLLELEHLTFNGFRLLAVVQPLVLKVPQHKFLSQVQMLGRCFNLY